MWRPFLPSSESPQPARSFNLCTKLLTKAIVTHQVDSDLFYAYLLSTSGINTPPRYQPGQL